MQAALLLAQIITGPTAPTPTPCPARPIAPPAEYAGWDAGMPVAAAATPAAVGDAMLIVGKGARATLQPWGALKLPVAPRASATAPAHGGLFAFEAAGPGRYRVALGARAWVDVVANGAALPAAAYGHGPACTAIRKIVDYDLKPGRYLLQITGEPSLMGLAIVKLA